MTLKIFGILGSIHPDIFNRFYPKAGSCFGYKVVSRTIKPITSLVVSYYYS